MGDMLFFAGIASIGVLYFLYWLLVFLLTGTILNEHRRGRGYRVLLALINTGLVLFVSTLERGSVFGYILVFILLLLSFFLLYKDTVDKILFCASACIIHIMAIRAIVTAVISMISGLSIYEVSNETAFFLLSISIAAIVTDLAIVGVIKFVPSDKIKIINEHKEQQWFMIAWMSVFNIYLIYNASVFSEPSGHPILTGNEFLAPMAILLGLYIVLFFAFKMAILLGYKEKSVVLQQAVYQEQQYRNATTKDAVIVYEINVNKDTLINDFDSNVDELGEKFDCYSDMMAFIAHRYIHSEDIEKFMRYAALSHFRKQFEMGKSEVTIEYRRMEKTGSYIWVRAVTNLVKNMETGDIIAFMCIKNIEAEKQHQLKLQYKAERDPLTGLYNKVMTGKLINEKLIFGSKQTGAALFMIDVDNFKAVNDHFGHLYGDAVLCELGDKLRQVFRAGDIIGRIGGDEYMAFMEDGATKKLVEERAAEICKSFYKVCNGTNDEKYVISGSVGIAFAPKDGNTFEELYHHSDMALYNAKGRKKNTYAFYDSNSFSEYHSNRTEIETEGANIPKSFRQNRIEYVFKILYQSENSKTAIRSVLELVSSHFAFERGYIFETSKDGKTTSNTFEWCAEGVKAHIDNLQNVPIDIVATAHTHFHKTGTFILRTLDDLRPEEREVLEPQDIKSMFQFGIFDHNNLLGFIGFDNCEEESVPSDADIDEITTICNILATFFVKQRISDESAKNLNSMVEVMNHLENYIYVINTETFEVLFMNERIGMLMEKEDVSPYCYSFFRGNDSQCPDCPVRKLMDEKRERSTAKIYNKKLGIWIETTASILRWMDGETACLVNCLDISKQYQMRQ